MPERVSLPAREAFEEILTLGCVNAREPANAREPEESKTVLAHWMGRTDANISGDIHGGTIMKLADEAASLAALRHSRRRTVTASIDRMAFLVPIKVGELVTFNATVNAAWNTSMEVGVRVEAENPLTGEVRHASSAFLTMVALDDEGRPTRVPPLVSDSPEDQRRRSEAELRRAHRLAERQAIEHGRRESAGDDGGGQLEPEGDQHAFPQPSH